MKQVFQFLIKLNQIVVLTAAECAAGCNVVAQAGGLTQHLVSSGPCCLMEGVQRHNHWEVLAEVWAAEVLYCAH